MPVASGRRRSSSERQVELTDAALRIVATRGIAALSTRSVAEERGLTSGALFRGVSAKVRRKGRFVRTSTPQMLALSDASAPKRALEATRTEGALLALLSPDRNQPAPRRPARAPSASRPKASKAGEKII
jgi:Bacterial regulatory proteins, tetR family